MAVTVTTYKPVDGKNIHVGKKAQELKHGQFPEDPQDKVVISKSAEHAAATKETKDLVPVEKESTGEADKTGKTTLVTSPTDPELTDPEREMLLRLDAIAYKYGGCVFKNGKVTTKFMKAWKKAIADGEIGRKDFERLIEATDPQGKLNIRVRSPNFKAITGGKDKVPINSFNQVVEHLYAEYKEYGMNLLELVEARQIIIVDDLSNAAAAREFLLDASNMDRIYAEGNPNILTRILRGVGIRLPFAKNSKGEDLTYYDKKAVEEKLSTLGTQDWKYVGRLLVEEIKQKAHGLDIEISFNLTDERVLSRFYKTLVGPVVAGWEEPQKDAFKGLEKFERKMCKFKAWIEKNSLHLEGVEDGDKLDYILENYKDMDPEKVGDLISLLVKPTSPQGGDVVEKEVGEEVGEEAELVPIDEEV